MPSLNKLYFEVLPTNNCRTLAIADMSTYDDEVSGATLQVKLPDRETVKELLYNTQQAKVDYANQKKILEDMSSSQKKAQTSNLTAEEKLKILQDLQQQSIK
jgi:hypothetical protein